MESGNGGIAAASIAMLYEAIVFGERLEIHVLNTAHRISRQEVITARLRRDIEFV